MLTDRGTEYCGKAEAHDYELYLQVAFRTKIYAGIDDLERDLDASINGYNNERTHEGTLYCGRTPFATMRAGKDIWNEKVTALN